MARRRREADRAQFSAISCHPTLECLTNRTPAIGVDRRESAIVSRLLSRPPWNPLLASLSGILGALSFRTWSGPPLVFVAFVPLLVAVARARGVRSALRLGWITGAVGLSLAFAWALPTIARFERVSLPAALPFFVLFVTYSSLQFALFAAGVRMVADHRPSAIRPQPVSCVTFTAAWWVLLEWGFPRVIPWSLGDPLAASVLLRQAADIGGVYGLSGMVMLVNACLAAAILVPVRLPRLRAATTAAALLALLMVYGALRIRARDSESTTTAELSVTIVQGGLRSGRDDLVQANEEAWGIYSSLSTQNPAPNTDLIVWPETVLRVYLRQDPLYRARVVDLVRRLRRPLFTGSLDLPPSGPGELNSGYLVDAQGSMQIYHKATLLPFGEYVPGVGILPLLRSWQTTGEFIAGDAAQPLTLSTYPDEHDAPFDGLRAGSARLTTLAPSICFEAIWPGAFNRLVRDGAALLINLTDDGWFGDSAGPYQHLNAARLRAVETRRWLVRASNSGVSAFVDPTGEIVAALPLHAVGVLNHGVGMTDTVSPYVRYGNWLIALCAGMVTAVLVRAWLSKGR